MHSGKLSKYRDSIRRQTGGFTSAPAFCILTACRFRTKSGRRRRRPSKDHPRRHGRVLCVGRAARQSGLRGKPIAVGGSRERGVVAAASYEARKFGVRSAMPSVTAKRQCPDLIFVKPRFEVYKAVSQQIREIFAEHTPIIEPLSLDEAYLDVTENLQNIPLARDVALAIRAKIKEVTGLNASAGISYNKFLAKLASDHRKPNGQYIITPEMGPAFVEALPVGKFHGIGPATSAKMNALGLHTGLDMRNQTLEFMQANFGKAGAYYYWISRGLDNREVRANRIRKSVGAENTFSTDLTEFDAMAAELQPLIDKVWRHCEDKGSRGRTVTLKVKFNDFEIITRSRSVPVAVASRATSSGCRSHSLRTRCPFPGRFASWGFLFLHCKATTKRNRNWASRFEGRSMIWISRAGSMRSVGCTPTPAVLIRGSGRHRNARKILSLSLSEI